MLNVVSGLPTYLSAALKSSLFHDETPDMNIAAARYRAENKMAAIKQKITPAHLLPMSATSQTF
jgi:hypothetical protein